LPLSFAFFLHLSHYHLSSPDAVDAAARAAASPPPSLSPGVTQPALSPPAPPSQRSDLRC
jgi:hypothetical protein